MEQFGSFLMFLWHFAVVRQNKPGLVPPSLRCEIRGREGLFNPPEFIFLASKIKLALETDRQKILQTSP